MSSNPEGPQTAGERAGIRARLAKANEAVRALCNGGRWTMSVPARPDHDPDLLIAASLADVDRLLEECDRMQRDSMRLDWLDAYLREDTRFNEVNYNSSTTPRLCTLWQSADANNGAWRKADANSLRAVIDAASAAMSPMCWCGHTEAIHRKDSTCQRCSCINFASQNHSGRATPSSTARGEP